MAYNNGREDRKWRIWKEAEEKVLREHGVDETTMVASPFPVVATMMSVVLKKQYLGKKKEGNPLLFYSSFLFSF